MREPPGSSPVFNFAGDAHVNGDVAELGLPILDTDVTFDRLPPEAGCTRAMTTEEVYHRLLPVAVVSIGSTAAPEPAATSAAGSSPSPTSSDDGSLGADAGRRRPGGDGPQGARSAAKDRGDASPGLASWAGQYLEPSVDWRAELRSVVSRRLGQRGRHHRLHVHPASHADGCPASPSPAWSGRRPPASPP